MPDNNFENITDKQFTDFAWGEMRKLLDEEMPVTAAPKKRRYLLLLLLLFFTLGSLATFLIFHDKMGNEEGKMAPPRPVATLNGQAIEENNNFNDDLNCPEGEIQSITPNKNIAYKKNSTQPKLQTPNANNPSSNLVVLESSTPKIERKQEDIQVNSPQLNQLQEEVFKVDRPLMNIASPLKTELGEISYSSPLENPMELPEVNKKSGLLATLLPNRLGLEGGVLSNHLAQIDGYHLGLTSMYNLGSKGWKMHTGIGYAIQNQEFKFGRRNGNSNLDAAAFDPNTEENTDVGNNQDTVGSVLDPSSFYWELDSLAQYATTSFSTQIHRLELPLLFSYRADDRLHLDFGVQASYIITATNSGGEEVFPYSDGLFRAAATFNQSQGLSSGSGFSGKDVNRFDLALRGGLSYYPWQNFGFRLHYQFGLINTSESARYRSHNRALRFSTVYYF